MKTMVMIACLFGSAFSQYWGLPQQVADTPEVAAAKSAHLAALARAHQSEPSQQSWTAQDRSWTEEDDGSYKPELYEKEGAYRHEEGDSSSWKADDRSWTPQAHSWAAQPQHWNAPQAHHAAQPQHWDSHEKKWTGPIALPPGFDKNGAPLQVLDTPEVAAEKSKHFHLYAHGAHAAAAAHAQPHAAAPSWN